jgi:putative endonuclease
VDIIAQKAGFLVFVEVKTIGSKKIGKPEEAINKKKIPLYKDAAEGYLEQYPSDAEIKFDVISIVIAKDAPQIEYFPDAF